MSKIINIANQFSITPGARYIKLGEFSGEAFRKTHLEPIFGDVDKLPHVQIQLDGVIGYAASFLEEAFGGIVRILKEKDYSFKEISEAFEFISQDDLLISEIQSYMDDADKDTPH
jgi:hypothetical protein